MKKLIIIKLFFFISILNGSAQEVEFFVANSYEEIKVLEEVQGSLENTLDSLYTLSVEDSNHYDYSAYMLYLEHSIENKREELEELIKLIDNLNKQLIGHRP